MFPLTLARKSLNRLPRFRSRSVFSVRVLALASIAFLLQRGSAADWEIFRFEGRDYVSVKNIAQFYGFPIPAPLPLIAPVLGMGATTPLPATAILLPPAPVIPPAPVLPRTIEMESGPKKLEFIVNSREMFINGAKQWLSFPTRVQDSHLLVSRLDLAKVIEPRLRPERITGIRPVRNVILDPGHGGHDKGAGGPSGFEKDFALDVSLRTRKILEARGYRVTMTRSTDIFIPLEARPQLAKYLPDSVFVSIHFNAGANTNAQGFEIFSMAPRGAPATNDPLMGRNAMREDPGNANDIPSGALAGAVYHSLLGNIPAVDRGLKQARFAVLRHCPVPAVLVECGFVSNKSELAQIISPEWRNRVAEAIVDGIDQYQELAMHDQPPKLVSEYRRGPGP